MLPPQVRAAVEARQPFHYDVDRRVNDPLQLLATFNNTDKHRVMLVSTLEPRSISHQFKVQFEGEATDQTPRVEVFATVQHGGLAVRHDTTPDRIQDVAGSADCVVQAAVVDGAGVPRGITSCLAVIGSHVQVVLGEVLGAWAGASH